jgi:hypothetical protein
MRPFAYIDATIHYKMTGVTLASPKADPDDQDADAMLFTTGIPMNVHASGPVP